MFPLAGMVQAQEALRSVLALDRTLEQYQRAPVDLRPDQSHLGPVQLSLGLYTGIGADDNLNLSQVNPRSDIYLRAGLNLGFSWAPTGQSEVRFATGLGYVHYVDQTRNEGLQITPDSALTYAISLDEVTVTLFDQFNYTQDVNTDAAFANVTSLARLENTIGARVAWNPNQWTLQAGYSHNAYVASDAGSDYLNRSSEYFFGRGGWRFAEATGAGLETSYSVTAYRVAVRNSNHRASVGAYADWQLWPALKLTLRGGPSFAVFDSNRATGEGSTLSSYYMGLDAAHQLTDFFSHHIGLARDVQPGLNQGSAYIEQFTANYSISWALTRWIGLTASLTYENGSQPLPKILPGGFTVETLEEFNRCGSGLQASWQVTDHLTGSVNYQYWVRESNLPGRGYTDNSVSFNLAYTF